MACFPIVVQPWARRPAALFRGIYLEEVTNFSVEKIFRTWTASARRFFLTRIASSHDESNSEPDECYLRHLTNSEARPFAWWELKEDKLSLSDQLLFQSYCPELTLGGTATSHNRKGEINSTCSEFMEGPRPPMRCVARSLARSLSLSLSLFFFSNAA